VEHVEDLDPIGLGTVDDPIISHEYSSQVLSLPFRNHGTGQGETLQPQHGLSDLVHEPPCINAGVARNIIVDGP
jgi:hypothetical protein